MRLGHLTNGISCEYKMQDVFAEWLTERKLPFIREKHTKANNRRGDFFVLKGGNQLINIEAKCNDLECMLRQLRDHSFYCDYSFAFIPDYCGTSKYFKETLMSKGYGLIVYNYKLGTVTEVLEAHQNKVNDKEQRRIICAEIRAANSKQLTI